MSSTSPNNRVRDDGVSVPAPVAVTERLVIRYLTELDGPFIVTLLNDEAFLRNIGDRGVRTEEDARAYIANGPVASYAKNGFGLFAVTLRSSGDPIGICGLLKRDTLDDVDLGFAMLPQYRSSGYALEAATAVMAYGRDTLGLERIVAIALPTNDKSIKLLEKLGFRFQKMTRLGPKEDELAFLAVNF